MSVPRDFCENLKREQRLRSNQPPEYWQAKIFEEIEEKENERKRAQQQQQQQQTEELAYERFERRAKRVLPRKVFRFLDALILTSLEVYLCALEKISGAEAASLSGINYSHQLHYSSIPVYVNMPPTPHTIAGLQELSNNPANISGYEELFNNIKGLPADSITDDLNAYLDHFLSAPLGLVHTRPLLDSFANTLGSLSGPGYNDVIITVGEHAIEKIQAQTSSFDEQNAIIRDTVATAYEADEDYEAAARVLSGINVSKYTNEKSVALWIRITRTLLEVDNTTDAESWLSKAKNLMYTIDNKELQLHFQLCQARILDARRQFLNAAQGYLEISHNTFIAEEERLHTLSMAIKCSALALAGPARSRMLRRLCQDERSSSLEEYGILEKMYHNRVILPIEVENFAKGLMAHQLATTADGGTVLDKAVVEHNLLAISKLYNNISFFELGGLLGLSGDKAESTTARMIEQGRLVGRMDQPDQTIYFEDKEASGEVGSKKSEGVIGKELRKYDANVQGLAESVERVTSDLQSLYPVSILTSSPQLIASTSANISQHRTLLLKPSFSNILTSRIHVAIASLLD